MVPVVDAALLEDDFLGQGLRPLTIECNAGFVVEFIWLVRVLSRATSAVCLQPEWLIIVGVADDEGRIGSPQVSH